LRDSFAAAQAAFNGYVGFSSALYLHGLIAELPLTVTVVTRSVSGEKRIGGFEFKAVALKEKAVGFERRDGRVVSTRAKTLFDCLLVPRYSIESEKLAQAFRQARLSKNEWKEFDFYVKKMVSAINAKRFTEAKKSITGR
jgi:predicted transcriptional regulator of viral defense system